MILQIQLKAMNKINRRNKNHKITFATIPFNPTHLLQVKVARNSALLQKRGLKNNIKKIYTDCNCSKVKIPYVGQIHVLFHSCTLFDELKYSSMNCGEVGSSFGSERPEKNGCERHFSAENRASGSMTSI